MCFHRYKVAFGTLRNAAASLTVQSSSAPPSADDRVGRASPPDAAVLGTTVTSTGRVRHDRSGRRGWREVRHGTGLVPAPTRGSVSGVADVSPDA